MIDEGLKNWKFVIATSVRPNEEKEFEKLKTKAKNYPIEFLVNKKNDDLWDIYSKAKIYWHATGFGEDLKTRPDFAEHFGISTVEAMGGGAVPVVINAGGQIEIVDEGVNGFLWENPGELEEKTLRLINSSKLQEGMGKEASNK